MEMGKQNERGRSEAKVCKVSVSARSCQALWIVITFEARPTVDKEDGFSYSQARPPQERQTPKHICPPASMALALVALGQCSQESHWVDC